MFFVRSAQRTSPNSWQVVGWWLEWFFLTWKMELVKHFAPFQHHWPWLGRPLNSVPLLMPRKSWILHTADWMYNLPSLCTWQWLPRQGFFGLAPVSRLQWVSVAFVGDSSVARWQHRALLDIIGHLKVDLEIVNEKDEKKIPCTSCFYFQPSPNYTRAK